MTKSQVFGPSRAETVLAYAGSGIILFSLVLILIAVALNLLGEDTENIAVYAQVPIITAPIGFVLILVLLILAARRKGRENKQ